jgi:peptide methionine sulfoxide reductase MsrA
MDTGEKYVSIDYSIVDDDNKPIKTGNLKYENFDFKPEIETEITKVENKIKTEEGIS